MLVWRAVRCCCQPQKIFGFMLVEESLKKIVLREDNGFDFEFPIIMSAQSYLQSQVKGNTSRVNVTRELAIKSEDHPIEFWRRQKGFVEVHHHD